MKLYLVRHAKSRAMENNERQSSQSPLSDEGRKQATALAKRIAREKIDMIISSKWDRAYQTAEIVSEILKLKFETIEGIHEKEQSPDLEGASFKSSIHNPNFYGKEKGQFKAEDRAWNSGKKILWPIF